jgi:integrase
MQTKISIYNANCDLSKNWFVAITCPGYSRIRIYKPINAYTTVRGRTRAANKLVKKISQLLENGLNPWKDGLVLEEKQKPVKKSKFNKDLDLLFSSLTLRKKSKQSLQSIYDSFCEYLEKQHIDNFRKVTASHCLKYPDYMIGEKKNSQVTVNNHVLKLKQLFKFLKVRGEIKFNPFDDVKIKPAESEGKWPFKDHQRNLLKSVIEDRNPALWLFIQFEYYLFIRPGEIRQMKIEYINLDEATITIPAHIAKNGKTQTIAIPNQMIPTMYRLNLHTYDQNFFIFSRSGLSGTKMVGINYMNRKHNEIIKELGFSNKYSIYSWKGTGAVAAVKAGVNLKELKEQLRHSSLDMTDKYLKKQGFIELDGIRNHFPEI